jgi:hypothetical protein
MNAFRMAVLLLLLLIQAASSTSSEHGEKLKGMVERASHKDLVEAAWGDIRSRQYRSAPLVNPCSNAALHTKRSMCLRRLLK